MISTKRAIKILTEPLPEKQTALIDKLPAQDLKSLLKIAMRLLRGEDVAA